MKTILGMLVPATVTAAQATRIQLLKTPWLAVAALFVAMNVGPADAATSASQVPLYTGTPGAKPNVMFVLDDSGSMARPYQEEYMVVDNCPISGLVCSGRYGWYAMRSSSVNTQYYNPAITYRPRLNANGTEQSNPLVFVDNQNTDTSLFVKDVISEGRWIPHHIPFTNSVPTGSKFSYVKCNASNTPCANPSQRTVVEIRFPLGSSSIDLPTPNNRSDLGCSAGKCTQEAELRNILNWYQWYGNRTNAVSTAVGQALNGYDNKFRLGYSQFGLAGSVVWGGGSITRGVRYFKDDPAIAGNNWKTEFYDWLYGVSPSGGTRTHQALLAVARYYDGTFRSTNGNPWKNDPTSKAEEDASDLSCRRSYAIVLSDGAWNNGSSSDAEQQHASLEGSLHNQNLPGGTTAFKFNPSGAAGHDSIDTSTRLAARNLYIPYADGQSSRHGFADLTARYYWNTDFSSVLPNNVPPIPGQNNPTFWQNLTTFTIGWGLTPSGDVPGATSGLKWGQINKYNNDWLAGSSLIVSPQWPQGDLNSAVTPDHLRIDDFIRAGFAGGGRAFSVYSGEDLRKAISNVLSAIVGSGNDAGVAVSGNSGDFQSLNSKLKYTTEYETSDNSGDIKAFALDANGGYANLAAGAPVAAWSANARKPDLDSRKIFALSNYDASAPSSSPSKRRELTKSTRLSNLPFDLQMLLNADNQQKLNSSFIRYLLGEDPQTDVDGSVYRSRKSHMGASVNSPPAFVGGRVNMVYDKGSVLGSSSYLDYKARKTTLPPTIFAATNDGKVHVLNAAKDDTTLPGIPAGTELAQFMPKGAMAAQVELAKPNYRFRYVLDGPVVEHDIYDENGVTPAARPNTWRQLVFGTAGRAGSFMYGLESPLNSSGNRTPNKNHFLWELDDRTPEYEQLANVTNNPTAGQLKDGTWVMLTGSGHYGAGKQVGLYIVEALTGKRKGFIPLPPGYGNDDTVNGGNRGLGGVVAVRDADRKIVAAYAGDANGNLWRFDLRSAPFQVSYNRPLFTTPGGKNQPIYATPAWQAHPGGSSSCTYSATSQCGAIVMFGTGILLDDDDLKTPASRQAIFGIWDQTPIGSGDTSGLPKVLTNDLVEQTIDLASVKNGTLREAGKTFYQVSSNSVDWATKKGWFLNLGVVTYPGAMALGERVVGDLSNFGSSVVIASFLPQDRDITVESCTAAGSLPNNIYVLDALTGKNTRAFDYDANGTFDSYSIVSIQQGGLTRGNSLSTNSDGMHNEGTPGNIPPSKCTGAKGFLTGVGGSMPIGNVCPVTGWRRSWAPVVSPPF